MCIKKGKLCESKYYSPRKPLTRTVTSKGIIHMIWVIRAISNRRFDNANSGRTVEPKFKIKTEFSLTICQL